MSLHLLPVKAAADAELIERRATLAEVMGTDAILVLFPETQKVRSADMFWPYTQGAEWGLLDYPDFYKVGVQHHFRDSRLLMPLQSDLYISLGSGSRAQRYPEDYVDRLDGRLMLSMSVNGYPAYFEGAAKFANALAIANKDLDVVFDNRMTWFDTPYQYRRGWDYFVAHLLGEEPPKMFKLDGHLYHDPASTWKMIDLMAIEVRD
ncbi:hypothetical protein [Paremcibacter congregatus]|uniref:hypothetical protein n=1 Tax=Paremcibacter congregatus TaxID=2043170 RepID=UPI003A8F18A5